MWFYLKIWEAKRVLNLLTFDSRLVEMSQLWSSLNSISTFAKHHFLIMIVTILKYRNHCFLNQFLVGPKFAIFACFCVLVQVLKQWILALTFIYQLKLANSSTIFNLFAIVVSSGAHSEEQKVRLGLTKIHFRLISRKFCPGF